MSTSNGRKLPVKMLFFVIFVVVHLTASRMITTADKLTLSVNPLSGSAKVGDHVKFTCSIDGPVPVAIRYHLYKVGGEHRVINASVKSLQAVFEIKAIKRLDEGRYFCVYDTEQFASVAYSNDVSVTVKGLLWPMAVGFRLGIVFILHLVVACVWCWNPGQGKDLKIVRRDTKTSC